MQIIQLAIFLLVNFLGITNADICEVCDCHDDFRKEYLTIDCTSKYVDLTAITWPPYRFKNARAIMRRTSQTMMPIISSPGGGQTIHEFEFDENEIVIINPKCFSGFPELKALSLNSNKLKSLQKGMFESAQNLTLLSIRNNSISSIEKGFFDNLKNLEVLNLRENKIKDFEPETFGKFLKTLDLSQNNIFTMLYKASSDFISPIRTLFLDGNRITTIVKTSFAHLINLRQLNLAGNSIGYIEAGSFEILTALEKLDLSLNSLKSLDFHLPESLVHLKLSKNFFETLTLSSETRFLQKLEIQNNRLTSLDVIEDGSLNLEILNASHNEIEHTSGLRCPKLRILDLSYNLLQEVPEKAIVISENLTTLDLSGNLFQNVHIRLPEHESLRFVFLNDLENLDTLQNGSLSALHSTQENCIEISIAHCQSLREIEVGAFEGLNICRLDLSYNALESIPEHLVAWTSIEKGINLQGNPFNCTCDEQWMLDIVLTFLYENDRLQHYLRELRCSQPSKQRGHRFVRYYGWPGAFCDSHAALMQADLAIEDYNDDLMDIKLHAGLGLYIFIALSLVVATSIIAFIIYTVRQQKAKKLIGFSPLPMDYQNPYPSLSQPNNYVNWKANQRT